MATETYKPGDLLLTDYPVQTITVTVASGQTLTRGAVLGRVSANRKVKLAATGAGDGSETPLPLILAVDVDASAADVAATAYVSGAFDEAKLFLGSGITLAAVKTACEDASAPVYLKTLA